MGPAKSAGAPFLRRVRKPTTIGMSTKITPTHNRAKAVVDSIGAVLVTPCHSVVTGAPAAARPPKMHKLAILMGYCNHVSEKFKNTKFEFRDLEAFTFVSRYPFLIPGEDLSPHEFLTFEVAQRCINQAKKMLEQIRKLLEE